MRRHSVKAKGVFLVGAERRRGKEVMIAGRDLMGDGWSMQARVLVLPRARVAWSYGAGVRRGGAVSALLVTSV
jgi:hypothetical protein